jgi:excinuclease ABC subunit B
MQTIGRAARNVHGRVIMYADEISPAMRYALDETARRRNLQMEYNEAHGITPKTIEKSVRDIIEATKPIEDELPEGRSPLELTKDEIREYVKGLEEEMYAAAGRMEFERAAELRDQIEDIKTALEHKK